MSADANSTSSAPPSTNGPVPAFSFLKKSIPISPAYVEQGIRDLAQEQAASVSAPAPTAAVHDLRAMSAPAAAHDLRKDGGIASSPAFASEHAKDAERFAALNLETRDQSVSLRYGAHEPMIFGALTLPNSTQLKRDFLLAQAAPPAPADFTPGPSLAHRPVSRTASMAGEVTEASTDVGVDDADAPPVLLPNHKEVSKILHLAAPPTTKAGTKEKAETAVAAAARANGNVTRLGGKIIANDARVDAIDLKITNGLRALESRAAVSNVGKIESRLDLLKSITRTGLSPDARLPLHTSQLAELTDMVDTLKRGLGLIQDSHLCSDVGVPLRNAFATPGDLHALYVSVQEGFDGLNDAIAEQLHPHVAKLQSAMDLLEKLEGRFAVTSTELLTVRENVARVQLDLGALAMGSKAFVAATAPVAATTAVPVPTAAKNAVGAYAFAVGGKTLNKRKPSIELLNGNGKRGKPNKAAFTHLTVVSPVNPDTKVGAVGLGKKLLEAAGIHNKVALYYVERSGSDAGVLNFAFATAAEANAFVATWSSAVLPAPIRAITARLAPVSGSSSTIDYSFLTGN
ncbi:hypothetical protein B0H14DRAFT_3487834 [Mycena olivaceomarginata]|nr:hypothetical protein B0H14DRAFT_3487834 [Mycena olivaceomarginata]